MVKIGSIVIVAGLFVAGCKGEEMTENGGEEEKDVVRKLEGKVVGTEVSWDVEKGEESRKVNTREMAFDGDGETFFLAYEADRSWVGLDLGEKHVITKVGYRCCKGFTKRVELGLFEGANEPGFADAVPIAMVKEMGRSDEVLYIDVNCTKGFRYVRYVGPNGSHCRIAELEFYGYDGEGDESRYYQLTNLPTVVINTDGGQDIVSKTEEIGSNVFIISDEGRSCLVTSETKVRGRGNYSWTTPKKPYRLKFAKKQSPLGAPAKEKKWTLINNYGDKTLMRNILAFEVSRRAGMAYTPFCQPVDVVVNGVYQGCYQLCDQVEVGDGRVAAKKGYLLEIDAYAWDEEVYFVSNNDMPVTVKYPKDDEITQQQYGFISGFFNEMEAALFGDDFTSETEGYRAYLDVESFLKNFIVGEFCGNTDTYWSVYMYKDGADGRLYTGPVWDYDLAFENDDRTHPINDLRGFIYETKGSVASSAVRKMVTRIVKEDPEARAQLKSMWRETRASLLDLCDYVDETAELLDESQKLNFKRWPILSERVHQNFQALGSYKAEVETVKSYIIARLDRMNELVNNL